MNVIIRLLIPLFALSICGGCAEERGTFRLAFSFENVAPPMPNSVDVYATVVSLGARTDANGGTGVPYGPGVQLNFDNVPYGEGITVEVRLVASGAGPDATPIYFGVSAPFDFAAGDSITIEVPFELVFFPNIDDDSQSSLVVSNALNGRVRTPDSLQLQVTASGADTIEVAQNRDFEVGIQSFSVATLQTAGPPDADGRRTYLLDYTNLYVDRPECIDTLGTCDGLVQLYARAKALDLTGPTATTVIEIDTVPPQVAAASVTYEAGAQNPLFRVRKATAGTTISVVVNFTEALNFEDAPPTLSATNGLSTIEFARSTGAAGVLTAAAYTATIDAASHTDGTYVPTLLLTDLAGNPNPAATFVAPAIEVDVTAEALQVDQASVAHIRAPFKNAASETLGSGYEIPEGTSFFELGPSDGLSGVTSFASNTFQLNNRETPTLLRFWADPLFEDNLGQAEPNPDGTWDRSELQLANVDSPRLYVTGVDAAGNESAPVLIQNGWYVASSGLSANLTSPHSVRRSNWVRGPLELRADAATPAAAARDGTAEISSADYRWRKRSGMPSPRRKHAMAYDSARGRAVLFGGQVVEDDGGLGPALGDTWEWDGSSWRQILTAPESTPAARIDHAMAYDSARGRVVLFGGSSTGRERDTWEWDGTTWSRIDIPEARAPTPRAEHQMAYDARRRQIVVFGGSTDDDSTPQDTWTYNGSAWTQIITPEADTPAGGFFGMSLAYDPTRETVVLWRIAGAYSQTWDFDGAAWTERPIPSIDFRPEDDINGLIVFDAARQTLVCLAEDTAWTWSEQDSGWLQLTSNVPPGVPEPAMVYDGSRREVVWFGASSGDQETWALNRTSFQEVVPSVGSSTDRVGNGFQMSHDQNGRAILFGGFELNDAGNPINSQKTWQWNGRTWSEVTTVGTPPEGSNFHAMAYDPSVNRMFALIASAVPLSETWRFNGGSWTLLPTGDTPTRRWYPAMAYDGQRLVMFGGQEVGNNGDPLDDTWVRTGGTWTLDTSSSETPPARSRHAMAYDAARGKVVMFGGRETRFNNSGTNDTWEWDRASGWQQIDTAPNETPDRRYGHKMIFDRNLQRVIMFGGANSPDLYADTWEWTGSGWSQIAFPADATPPEINNHAATYHPNEQNIVLYGTPFGAGADIQTWVLESPNQSDIQFDAALPLDLSASDVLGVRVRAYCGGTYQVDDRSMSGATLYGWTTPNSIGRFQELDRHSTGLPIPRSAEPLAFQTSDPAVAQGLILQRKMHFQCRPNGASGSQRARVGLDYVEARIRYQAR